MHKTSYILAVSITCLSVALSSCSKSPKLIPEPPAIIHTSQLPAGWYSHDAHQLNKELDNYLALAQEHFPVPTQGTTVKALIAPHAGYYYSGLAASTAYQTLLTNNPDAPLDQ